VGREHRSNGGDNGSAAKPESSIQAAIDAPAAAGRSLRPDHPVESSADQLFVKFSGDAPLCDICGHITVRNATCYKCMNCGNSMGCS
jgi:ribonucleoside-diphosphate reductase alpha chain